MLRGYRSAFVAIGLVLLCGPQGLAQHPGLPEGGQTKQNEQIDQEQRKPEAEQRPEPAPAATQTDERKADHSGTISNEPNQRTNDYLFWGEPPAQWIMAGASVASVVVAFVAVVLVWCTLREARKTTRAAIRSVVQARRAVQVTRDIGHKQLAAFIHIGEGTFEIENDSSLTVTFVAKNLGKTPAFSVEVVDINLHFRISDQLYGFPLFDFNKVSIAPEDTEEIICSSDEQTDSSLQLLWNAFLSRGPKVVQIHCKLKWVDINRDRHVVPYAMTLSPDPLKPKIGTIDVRSFELGSETEKQSRHL